MFVTNDEEAAVRGLMNAVLPGGGLFPSAGETGMGGLLTVRLRAADATLPGQLAQAAPGMPTDAAGWHAAAARLEATAPTLFDAFRKLAYLTYYEQPAVIAAIRALGFRYNESPLPEGYPAEPFDPARDGPHHGRGRWVPTSEVRRVDLSGLALEEDR
jgi:hypothetical protein